MFVGVAVMMGCSAQDPQPASGAGYFSDGAVELLAERAAADPQLKSQRVMLEDGVVTEAEYRQAYIDATECMTRAGMEVTELQQVPSPYGYTFSFIAHPGSLDAATASTVSDGCERMHDMLVAQAWVAQTGGTYTLDALVILQDCFREHDVDPGDASTRDEFVTTDANVFDTCYPRAKGGAVS